MKRFVLKALFVLMILPLAFSQVVFAQVGSTSSPESVVNSIVLSSSGDDSVSWVSDAVSSQGFKVVWSKTSSPTYPTRSGDQYQYFSDSTVDSASLTAFEGSGKYYVRVCEYLGGVCGTYSNEISLDLVGATVAKDVEFADLDATDDSYEAISYFKVSGVLVGYSDGTFKPDNSVNRAEFLKIVMEATGKNAVNSANCFTDVSDEWFASYICTAKDLGLVDGYPDGNFRPAQDINFVEASKIIAEAFDLALEANSASGEWFAPYVFALEYIYAIPVSVDSFDKKITRSETAEIAWRVATDNSSESSKTYTDLKVEPTVSSAGSSSIVLSDLGNGSVSWDSGFYSKNGYKLVWSLNQGPTYPTRSTDKYQYFSDPNTSTAGLKPFSGNGKYYVRVCEYLGGTCGVYSNEIQVELTATTTSTVEAASVNSITLSGVGADISWVVDGSSAQGYKVVWSMTSGPTYPLRTGDKYQYFSDSSVNSASLTAFDVDGTYYVRVCEYLGGACGVYSNEITVNLTGGTVVSNTVSSIVLSDSGNALMSWVSDGVSAEGYKVVWSKTAAPTYPTRSSDQYLYFSSSDANSGTIDAFDGAGTYHVRVCEYVGGTCGVYSNELEVLM